MSKEFRRQFSKEDLQVASKLLKDAKHYVP